MTNTELHMSKPAEQLLFVDDEKNILGALRRLFRPLGYTIHLAQSGCEGLEILQQHPIDLVISDMRMPEMDGAEFLEAVAERWPDTIRFLLTGFADVRSTVDAINKGKIYRYLSKPWEDTEITLSVKQALQAKQLEQEKARLTTLVQKQNAELKSLNEGLEAKVAARTEEIRQTADMLDLAYSELSDSYQQTIRVFASLISMRESLSGRHAQQVADLARAMARARGLDDAQVRDIYFSGLLHELGKLSLPDEILRTPPLKLKAKAFEKYQKYPSNGQTVLTAIETLQDTAAIIRSQEEHFDGRGFPDHLRGEDIPLGARILCVARDFQAHQNGRLSGERRGAEETLQHMQTLKGRRYDPVCLDLLAPLIAKLSGTHATKQERICTTQELLPGMKLSRDLFNRNELLLLTRGRVLNENLIHKLRHLESLDLGKYEVFIYRSSTS